MTKVCKICSITESRYFYGKLCADCFNKQNRERYWKNIEQQRIRGRTKYEKYKEVWNPKQKDKSLELKKAVYDHYGRICNCCGEIIEKFLTIDHVNNDGNVHRDRKTRKDLGGKTRHIHAWIVKNNFPDSIQILCWNCNCGRAKNNGICPHKEHRNIAVHYRNY